jgi:hypothetical protein
MLAGGISAAALVAVTATAASAHFTCNDGTTTEIDDPAVACAGHNGIAAPAAPTTMAADHDHAPEAPATTRRRAATPTTRPAVKATPSYTG